MAKLTMKEVHKIFEGGEQSIFDYVAKHLRQQEDQAYDLRNDKCVYLQSNGKMCAVGCLVPKGIDAEKVSEGSNLVGLIDGLSDVNRNLHFQFYELLSKHENLLQDLQIVHDNGGTIQTGSRLINRWVYELGLLAEKYNLKFDKEAWLQAKFN